MHTNKKPVLDQDRFFVGIFLIRSGERQRLRVGAHNLAQMARNHMSKDHMRVLFLFDILARSQHSGINNILELSSGRSQQADSGCAALPRQLYGVNHIW